MFHRDRTPRRVDEVYELLIRPIVETYQAMGIEAYHRPINDIQVAGRKIGGTGAALIGETMVMAGSLMFDFNTTMMSRALKVPSEKMRDKIFESLQEYMTTLRKELGVAPAVDAVKEIFIEKCEQALGVEVYQGELTARELEILEELDRRFVSDEWLNLKGGLPKQGVKIKEGLRVVEASHKAPGGLIRATTLLADDRYIDDLTLSGDFTILPSRELAHLEETLEGEELEEEPLAERVEFFYRKNEVQTPGIGQEDWVKAVVSGREAG
jgi:lipoate-protein ligase A